MAFICVTLAALAVALLFKRRRARAASSGAARQAPFDEEDAMARRSAIRPWIVDQAGELRDLEEQLTALGEGSSPDLRDQAEYLREKALRLYAKLAAECKKHRLPIGLVHNARSKRATRAGSAQAASARNR